MNLSLGKVYNYEHDQEEDIHSRWHLPTHNLSQDLSQARLALITTLCKSRSSLAYFLLTHTGEAQGVRRQKDTFTQEHIRYLTNDILAEAKSLKDGTNQIIILGLILEQGNIDYSWR
ncbi:hypothetical protein JYT55_01355, partial [Mariprofundus ferrooxydans]|nr:hypothetical protein [Mariprofundus ferrooxydans]